MKFRHPLQGKREETRHVSFQARPLRIGRTDRDHRHGVPVPGGKRHRGLLAPVGNRGKRDCRGSSGFRRGTLGPDLRRQCGAKRGLPLRRVRRRYRPVRRRLLPHLPGGGRAAGSAAAHDAGGELAGAGGRGHRSGSPEAKPHGGLLRDQQRRVPHARGGVGQARRGRGVPLRPQRHQPERHRRAGLLRARADRAGQGRGRRLRLRDGGDQRRRGRSASRQGEPGHCGWRAGHPERAHLRVARGRDDAVPRWTVQDVRRLRERLRPGRGVRGRGPQAPERRRGGRRPNLGGDPGLGGQPRRDRRGADGAEHARSGAGDGGRALPGGHRSAGGGLRRGARNGNRGGRPHRAERGRQRVRPWPRCPGSASDRVREDQRGPSGVGGGRRRTHQGGARGQAGRDPEAPALSRSQSGGGLGSHAAARDRGEDGLAAPTRPAARGRGELLRHLRDERAPRGAGVSRLGRGSRRASSGDGIPAGGSDATSRQRGAPAASRPGDAAAPVPFAAAVRQVGYGAPGVGGAVPVVARRADRGAGDGGSRRRAAAGGHGVDRGRGAQSFRSPRGRGLRGRRVAAPASNGTGGIRGRSTAGHRGQGRVRLHRAGKPVGRDGPGTVRDGARGAGRPGPL